MNKHFFKLMALVALSTFICGKIEVWAASEDEVLTQINNVATTVKNKSKEEMERIYGNAASSDTSSAKMQSYYEASVEAQEVNSAKNKIVSKLGSDSKEVYDSLVARAQKENTTKYDTTIAKSYESYENLRLESEVSQNYSKQMGAIQNSLGAQGANKSKVSNTGLQIKSPEINLPKITPIVTASAKSSNYADLEASIQKNGVVASAKALEVNNPTPAEFPKISNAALVALNTSRQKSNTPPIVVGAPSTTPVVKPEVVAPAKTPTTDAGYKWAGGGKFVKIGNEEFWVDSTGRQPDGTLPGQPKTPNTTTASNGASSYKWAGGGHFVKVDDQEYWVDSTLHQPDGSPLPKTKAVSREEEWQKPLYDTAYWVSMGGKERYRKREEMMPDQIEVMMKTLNPEQLKLVNKEDVEYEKYMQDLYAKGAENSRNISYPEFCPYPNFVIDMNNCISPDGYNIRPGKNGTPDVKEKALRLGRKIYSSDEWVKLGAEGRAEARRNLLHGQLKIIISSLNTEQQAQIANENVSWKAKIPAGVLLAGNVFDPYKLPKDSNFLAESQRLRSNPYGLFANELPATGLAGQIVFIQTGADFARIFSGINYGNPQGQWQSGDKSGITIGHESETYVMFEWVPKDWAVVVPPTIDNKYGERFYKYQARGNPYSSKYDDFEVTHLTRDADYFRNGGK